MAKGKTNYPGGGVDTSDATAVASDILSSKTAYGSAGVKITGTMTNKQGSATVITPSSSDQTIPQGYYGGVSGDGKVLGDADLVAGNIKSGVNIFGINGTLSPSPTTIETGTYAEDTSAGVRYYYRKFGKLYIFGMFYSSGFGTARFSAESNARARICSILGITESEYYQSEANFGAGLQRWNGTNWYSSSGYPCLYAILAT